MEKHIYQYLCAFDFSQKAVLCSQLEHRGSVPRKDYPVMLVTEHGRPRGTIGGGAIEQAVIDVAHVVLQDGQPRFRGFDLTSDDPDQEVGICGGSTRILIEPYTPSLRDLWTAVDLANLREPGIILITEVVGDDVLQVQRHILLPGSSGGKYPEDLRESVEQVWSRKKSCTLSSPAGFHLIASRS